MESITVEKVKNYVNVLADDSFEGRETGSRGGRAAGAYLGEQFQKLNLKAPAERRILPAVRFGQPQHSRQDRRQRSGVEKGIRHW